MYEENNDPEGKEPIQVKETPKGSIQPVAIISMPEANEEVISNLLYVLKAHGNSACPIYITPHKLEILNLKDIKRLRDEMDNIIKQYEKK